MRFSNKACIVTGSGSGIGRATAIRMALEGAQVIIADRNEDGGNETVDVITKQNGTAFFVKCDVGIEEDIKQVVDKTVEKWRKIDVLVNNAAMMTFKDLMFSKIIL